MSNFQKAKKQWDALPQDLKEFAPKIKQNLTDFWYAAAVCDQNNLSIAEVQQFASDHQSKTQSLLEEFRVAGGNHQQWNFICEVVNNGYDAKLKP